MSADKPSIYKEILELQTTDLEARREALLGLLEPALQEISDLSPYEASLQRRTELANAFDEVGLHEAATKIFGRPLSKKEQTAEKKKENIEKAKGFWEEYLSGNRENLPNLLSLINKHLVEPEEIGINLNELKKMERDQIVDETARNLKAARDGCSDALFELSFTENYILEELGSNKQEIQRLEAFFKIKKTLRQALLKISLLKGPSTQEFSHQDPRYRDDYLIEDIDKLEEMIIRGEFTLNELKLDESTWQDLRQLKFMMRAKHIFDYLRSNKEFHLNNLEHLEELKNIMIRIGFEKSITLDEFTALNLKVAYGVARKIVADIRNEETSDRHIPLLKDLISTQMVTPEGLGLNEAEKSALGL